MEDMANTGLLSGWLGTPYKIAAVLFVFTLVVFVHELGHFLVARWNRVRVLVFWIGFGPELIGFTDRHDTRWKISAVPLGGSVNFLAAENAATPPTMPAVRTMTEADPRE